MAQSLAQELASAEARQTIAATKLDTLQMQQTYRALEDSHNRHKRRTPSIEMKGEDESVGQLGRLISVAKARDNRRNFGGAKATSTQIQMNVVGTGPKCIVHLEDEGKAEAWSDWFNGPFSKNCDGRGNLHLADQARIAQATVHREGDLLVFFDSTGVIPDAKGTLWYWEADQMPELSKAEWKAHKTQIEEQLGKSDLQQGSGRITDGYDRTVGYIATKKAEVRGKATAKYDEVTILPTDDCTLLMNPWRINQGRGVSDTIEIANMWQDLERFIESLQQRALVQSFMAIKIKKKDGIAQGRGAVSETDNSDGVPDLTSDETTSNARYKNFEKWAMNAIEYMNPDEDAEAMQMAGDLPDAQQMIDFMQGQAGWAQGLSAMFATGKADASYSASMAENNLTWPLFEWWQKWEERYYYDWVATRAFRYGIEAGKIEAAPEAEWLDKYSFHGWPKRRAINPSQEASATRTNLEIGAITYEDIWGPGWKKHTGLLGEQIKWSRDHGLFVPSFPVGTRSNNT